MKHLLSVLAAVLSLGVLLGGCKTAPKMTGISVTIVDFKPVDAAGSPGHPLMVLRFTSESVNPVAFSNSSYKLYLNGVYAGKAASESPIGIPPMGTVNLNVPLTLENPSAVRQALGVSGEISKYRLETVLHFTEDDHDWRITPNFDGTVSLIGLETAVH